MHPTPCRLLIHDEDIQYTSITSPWPLNPNTHSQIPPQLGTSHFCKCLWHHIAPGPFIVANPVDAATLGTLLTPGTQVDPYTSEFSTIWTPRADHYLSILWFWSRLHEGKTGAWTGCHYHEVLSILLGYRVVQHDFFARARYMRNKLPEVWLQASMQGPDSPKVVEVFREANAKWEAFVGKFELWNGYVKEICVTAETEGQMERLLQPGWQEEKSKVDMPGDVKRLIAATPAAEELPEHIVRWKDWWASAQNDEATD